MFGGLVLSAALAVSYTSLLRVGEEVLTEPAAEVSLWKTLDRHPGAFGEISVFSQNNHAIRSLARHRVTAERARTFLATARARGYSAGVNLLCTLGFMGEAVDPACANLPGAFGGIGSPCAGRICAAHPASLDYVRELYRLYASARPDVVYVDDDVSCAVLCYCERCRKQFRDETGFAVRDDCESADRDRRRRARSAWIDFASRRMDGVLAAAAEAVHGVDPSIEMGLMTCTTGASGFDCARWARTLGAQGRNAAVRWRPGGGAWTDRSVRETLEKALRMAAQVRYVPTDVSCVQAEIESFPFQSLDKSPSWTAFEALLYLATSSTGVAWDLFGFSVVDMDEFAPYVKRVAESRPVAEELVSVMGRESATGGVAFAWGPHSVSDAACEKWSDFGTVPLPEELAEIGIPVAEDWRKADVVLLNESLAEELPEADVRTILSRAAFLDAGALSALIRRGFGELLGFAPDGETARDAIVRDLDHPLNRPGRNFRNVRGVFGHHGGIPLLKKADAAAEWTVQATDLSGGELGKAGGVFANKAGGRIAVETMCPFTWCAGRARADHLKRLFRWLVRDGLDAAVVSFHRVALVRRGSGAYLANLATEDLEAVEVSLSADGDVSVSLNRGGVPTGKVRLSPIRREGGRSVFRLDRLPVLGGALFRDLK